MPPTSSTVHRLSSAPSAASTVLNIASRSPPHPLATSQRVREGRSPRPLLGDVIATPRHHLATDRPATSSDRAAHRRSAILPASSSSPSSSILQVVRAGHRVSQGGPPLPAHPSDTLHHAGVPRHICGHPRR